MNEVRTKGYDRQPSLLRDACNAVYEALPCGKINTEEYRKHVLKYLELRVLGFVPAEAYRVVKANAPQGTSWVSNSYTPTVKSTAKVYCIDFLHKSKHYTTNEELKELFPNSRDGYNIFFAPGALGVSDMNNVWPIMLKGAEAFMSMNISALGPEPYRVEKTRWDGECYTIWALSTNLEVTKTGEVTCTIVDLRPPRTKSGAIVLPVQTAVFGGFGSTNSALLALAPSLQQLPAEALSALQFHFYKGEQSVKDGLSGLYKAAYDSNVESEEADVEELEGHLKDAKERLRDAKAARRRALKSLPILQAADKEWGEFGKDTNIKEAYKAIIKRFQDVPSLAMMHVDDKHLGELATKILEKKTTKD